MSETKGGYYFYKNYTQIKRTFDAEEMEKSCRLLRAKRQEQNAGTDGDRSEGRKGNSQALSSSP